MRRHNNHTIWFAAFLLLIFSSGCCNPGAKPVLTPPTVISVAPLSGAAGVCPNTTVTATFSVAMKSTSINGTTFTLTGPGTTPVAGVVTYDASSNTAIFTPSSALALSTLYTATITTGARDEVGVALANNFVWTFTTGSNPCIPPTVISVTPPNGAAGVCPNTLVTATFSQPMNPATINTTTFTLTGPGTTPVTGVVTYAASTATFTPSSPLALSTLYTATITTGAQDLAGNPLANNYVWTFTTSSTPCIPTVISVTPPNGAVGVCPSTVVTATFSEPMNPDTINTTTFTLTGPGTTPVTGVVSYAASTATFVPSSPLALSTLYTATITTGAQDLAGNPLANNFVWTFTTNSTACAPTVISVAPPDGASGICPNSVVVATFSEAMNPATINTTTFTLTGPGITPVAGTVTYVVSSYVATFTPTNPLALDTLYTATITTGAQDLAGDPLANNFVWTFTTSATACQAPVPLGSACSFGILGATPVVSNSGPSNVTGDVGIWPAASITGFPPGTITGSFHAGDAVAMTAQGDLTTAYNYAAAAPGGAVLTADIGGETLAPGVYKTTSAQPSLGITGDLTLDGGGNSNGVWIFQIVSSLTTAATNSQVILTNGATAQNVFWQVGSSATLGTTTTFAGSVMAQASVTLGTGATLNGRALARTGAVTLLSNPVNVPPCQ
ncbi:MAG TPA: Ig-like domain-containing protein [Candidatus Limnocylindrales bacterium]|nr:Ig-like domain-containing protein [Candidatus Limnocylindrales bacterium]